MTSLGRLRLAIGGLIAVLAGVLLAALMLVVVTNLGGNPKENSSYCSTYGIGNFEEAAARAGKEAVYVTDGWGGFPPSERCRVYALDLVATGQPISAEEALTSAPPPHFVIAEGSYPGWSEWAWVIGAFLVPPAFWAFYVLTESRRRRGAENSRE